MVGAGVLCVPTLGYGSLILYSTFGGSGSLAVYSTLVSKVINQEVRSYRFIITDMHLIFTVKGYLYLEEVIYQKPGNKDKK